MTHIDKRHKKNLDNIEYSNNIEYPKMIRSKSDFRMLPANNMCNIFQYLFDTKYYIKDNELDRFIEIGHIFNIDLSQCGNMFRFKIIRDVASLEKLLKLKPYNLYIFASMLHGFTLDNLKYVKNLTIERCGDIYNIIPHISNVKHLIIASYDIKINDNIEKFKNIEKLVIDTDYNDIVGSDFEKFKNLKYLYLKNSIRLMSLNLINNDLHELQLFNCKITKDVSRNIVFNSVRRLSIVNDGDITDDSFAMMNLNETVALDIDLCYHITGKCFQYFPNLMELRLRFIYVRDPQYFSHLWKLRKLDINFCDNDEIFQYFPNLEELSISGAITGEGFKFIPNLKKLNMTNCYNVKIDKLQVFTQLEDIEIDRCCNISEWDVKDFRQKGLIRESNSCFATASLSNPIRD
jgi:hypothetical protein